MLESIKLILAKISGSLFSELITVPLNSKYLKLSISMFCALDIKCQQNNKSCKIISNNFHFLNIIKILFANLIIVF
jgi:hypothetical protein